MYDRKNEPGRENLGKISQELLAKTPDTRDPIELERSMQKDYLKNVWECVERSKSIYSDQFYVTVLTKQEYLMPNVFRNYFFARKSCPTPNYDQSVFRYTTTDDKLEYIWTIPDRDTCYTLVNQALLVAPEEQELLNFVLQFKNGELAQLAMQLNNEIQN
jgi:hypothetical protein